MKVLCTIWMNITANIWIITLKTELFCQPPTLHQFARISNFLPLKCISNSITNTKIQWKLLIPLPRRCDLNSSNCPNLVYDSLFYLILVQYTNTKGFDLKRIPTSDEYQKVTTCPAFCCPHQLNYDSKANYMRHAFIIKNQKSKAIRYAQFILYEISTWLL